MKESEAFEIILPTLQHDGFRYVVRSRRRYEVDGVAHYEFLVAYFANDDVLDELCEGHSDAEREIVIKLFKTDGHTVRIVVDDRGTVRRDGIDFD